MDEAHEANGIETEAGTDVDIVEKAVEPIPIMTFEGAVVSHHEGKIPAIALDMSDGYPRGTHLQLVVEVRVRNVSMVEDPKTGDLRRQHVFALEDIQLVRAFTAEEVQRAAQPGGSASGAAQDKDLDAWLNGED